MEKVYREFPTEEIPWNLEDPPAALADLVESGRIQPCDAVDLGCGAGNYAVWLASKGFRVTGIDLSPAAIALAADLAGRKGVDCRYLARDLTEDVDDLAESFDLAYDWEVLHHVFPEDREAYVRNVHRILRPGGTYLSACFSEEDTDFEGTGKYRKTRIGTTLYFSSEEELRELFEKYFVIRELYTSEIAGKYRTHMAVIAVLERKGLPAEDIA
jgi:2-polyprenyl-3-methyl-5-hydroxy-6-metoxy-1,4-benzoquinol methylase